MEEVQVLLSTYGLWFVALVVTADQLGIPIPAPPALVVCGGLVGTGQLDAGATLLAATLPALAADLLWFEIGRRKGHGVLRLLCRISLEPDSCVRSTRASFERRGPKTLLFAKFVPGLQTIAPPLAGASGMSPLRFLLWSTPGALLWAGSFLVLGALFKDQVDHFLALLASFGGWLGLVLVGSLAIWIAWKVLHRRRFLRALRIARIEPAALDDMIRSGAAPEIYDLRGRLEFDQDARRIPGARAIGLEELEHRHHEIPRDREIVVYCT
ncbi:MAG: VTT domain-containing protein [Spirochaetaceae bacterium]|nr:VTT domain-containing protein [Myxococcales bacterium]MCB9723092.1 VTT domain-containing protein [Spirochaetaceae bacterium]